MLTYDASESGSLSLSQSQSQKKKFLSLRPQDFDQLFKQADKNKDDKLSYDEFVDWVLSICIPLWAAFGVGN